MLMPLDWRNQVLSALRFQMDLAKDKVPYRTSSSIVHIRGCVCERLYISCIAHACTDSTWKRHAPVCIYYCHKPLHCLIHMNFLLSLSASAAQAYLVSFSASEWSLLICWEVMMEWWRASGSDRCSLVRQSCAATREMSLTFCLWWHAPDKFVRQKC